MSLLGSAIRYILINDTDVSDVIGTRVFPLVAPQNAATPYITYQTVSDLANDTKSGTSAVDQVRVQINMVANNERDGDAYDVIMDLRLKVRTIFDRYPHGLVGSTGVRLDGVSYVDQDLEYEHDTNMIVQKDDYYFRQKYV